MCTSYTRTYTCERTGRSACLPACLPACKSERDAWETQDAGGASQSLTRPGDRGVSRGERRQKPRTAYPIGFHFALPAQQRRRDTRSKRAPVRDAGRSISAATRRGRAVGTRTSLSLEPGARPDFPSSRLPTRRSIRRGEPGEEARKGQRMSCA